MNHINSLPAFSEEFRAIIDASMDGGVLVDSNGRFLHANNVYCRMLGYNLEQLLSMRITQVETIDSPEDVARRLQEIIKGNGLRFENQHRRSDGTYIDIEVSCCYVSLYGGVFVSYVRDISEKKILEKSSYRNSEFYKNLVEANTDFIDRYLPGGVLTYVNPALANFTGVEAHKLLGKSFFPFVLEDDRKILIPLIESINRDNPTIEVDTQVALPDGSVKWNRWTHSGIFDENGDIIEYQAVGKDITQRKQAEQLQKESEEKFRFLYELSSDAIFFSNTDGHIFSANKAACTMFDMTEEELRAAGRDGIINRNDPRFAPAIEERRRTGKVFAELTAIRKNGDMFPIELTSIITKTEPQQSFIIIRDISERKRAERLLVESTEKFTAAFDNAPIMIAINSMTTGCFVEVNQQFLTVSGYLREEIIGKSSNDLEWITEPDRAQLKERILQFGSINDQDVLVRTKGDSKKVCKYHAKVITIGAEKFLLSTSYDITEQRRVEQQLQQSQKLESIGLLAGGVAHDFNNKIMVIMGGVQLARMALDDKVKASRYLDEIQKAAEHSRDITSRLLAFSRRQVTNPKTICPNTIISESLKSLSRLIGEQILISCDLAGDLWSTLIDPVQLDQIIINMAVNAKDAMEGAGTLTIETQNISVQQTSNCINVPGDYVRIEFRDSGIGMDVETVEHIFDPFFTTKAVGKGTGLGLATIYGIVKQSKGFIDVSSAPGKGTVFMLYLPRHDAAAPVATTPKSKIFPGNASILLVEDEDAVRLLTASFLKKIGYRVHEAHSPQKALQIVRDRSIEIDVVVTDVIMPEISGTSLMEQIRAIRPTIACVYVSGYSTDHTEVSKIIEKGFVFMAKPYDLIELSAQLKDVLSVDGSN